MKLDEFTKGYIEAALWSTTDDCDDFLDERYSASDIASECLARMVEDCRRFQEENVFPIQAYCGPVSSAERAAGIDFWLTRNRHGSGFWDSPDEWPMGADKLLTERAHEYNEVHLYVGDDGLIYS